MSSPPIHPNQVAEPSLKWEVVHGFEDPNLDETEWDDLAKQSGAEIYQSYRWSKTWWDYYGEGRDLHILVFHSEAQSVAILPFMVETIGWGPFKVRIAKQLASDYTMGTMVPPVPLEFFEPVCLATHRHFLEEERCDAIRWGPITGIESIEGFSDALQGPLMKDGYVLKKIPHGVESILDLPDDFESYLGGLSKNHRTNYRRSRNKLERETNYVVRVIEGSAGALESFEEFKRIHTRQWEAVGEPGHFGDWPKAEKFHQEMVKSESATGRLALVCSTANGEMVSAQYGYTFGDQFTWLLPARRMEEEWNKYGLGRVGFIHMVEAAIQRGCRRIHLGGAYWGYKSDLGGKEEPTESLIVTQNGEKLRRIQRLQRLMKGYGILYYRIWFKRIAPRLPWCRGPLWDSWIRGKL
ncbi:MAG: GNAT family N-acetyltransferase [Candidatus Omnitrophica bacterium]|nr:GNAT family N-acetyltransferase [Candidatus Omnitrophota bacterium]